MKPELKHADTPALRRVVATITTDNTLTNDERVIWLYLFDHRDSDLPEGGYLPVSGVRLWPMGTQQQARNAMNGLIRKGRVIEIQPASFVAADGVYRLKDVDTDK